MQTIQRVCDIDWFWSTVYPHSMIITICNTVQHLSVIFKVQRWICSQIYTLVGLLTCQSFPSESDQQE